MDESEDNMSSEDIKLMDCPFLIKAKPKKRSLVERELETNLTARVTSPASTDDTGSTSRYGRARRAKTDADYIDTEKGIKLMDSAGYEKTPVKVQSPVYKMHASNSPIKTEPKVTPVKAIETDSILESQIESIYHENISLSRFGSDEKNSKSPGKKIPKVYVRKDLIQTRDKEEYVMMIKNLFSPPKSAQKSNNHLNNILERSSTKYSLNTSVENSNSQNGFLGNSSVVKTLDFDNNKKKKKENIEGKVVLTKSNIFDMEAKCEYQVGDLAWARMGTFPFWPCIITREPASGMFVKKKLFGRIERDIIHVTFFGDNGRRGWIVETMLRKFLGQLEFEATRETFSPSAKKKDPRLYAAFFVSEKKMPQWNISVEEAESLLREPKRLRIDILYDMLAKSRSIKSTTKLHKSGKITRTASDVASDVSLSESLFDTLFSEDDVTKSEDTERSRSKTRLSLDVSEVVTACLDNMAAKTGITKIQRQSHMDRWLQKAKSKTPEKTQANFPPPQKDKELKVVSAKKKKKFSPVRVPIQKPYSFRKSSYEPQILKSHDNEHDYSTKTSNDLPQAADDNGITVSLDIDVIAKVEPLQGEVLDGVNTDTKGDQTIEDSTIDSVLKKTDTDITPEENANNTIHIGSVGKPEEQMYEIQVDMCSVEENGDLLLEHTDKNESEITIILDKENPKAEKQIQITKQADNFGIDAKNDLENFQLPQEKEMDIKELPEITTIPDKQRKDKKRTIKITQTNAGHTKVTEKPTEKTQASADFKRNSEDFVKYLELRQDDLIDEHPELSQDEIEDYLYKTWQYAESSKSDFKKNDDSTQSCLVKGLNVNLRHKPDKNKPNENKKGKKCLSLNSNASKKRSKKPDENTLSTESFLSNTSFSKSLKTKFPLPPAISMDVNKIISCVNKESSMAKEIESTQIVTEHSYTEKYSEIRPKSDEPEIITPKLFEHDTNKEKNETSQIEGDTTIRRSLRTRLSNSPAMTVDTNKRRSSLSNESTVKSIASTQIVTEHSYTEKHSEMTDAPEILEMDTPTLLTDNTNKEKIETPQIHVDTSVRRSLRSRLSNSPAMTINTNKSVSCVSEDSSTVKEIESIEIKTEHTEKHSEMTKKQDESITDIPKLSEHILDEEKLETTQKQGDTSVRRSLRRSGLSNSPAMTIDTNERTSSVNKESSKAIAGTQIVTEHSYTEIHPEMTQKQDKHEMDTLKQLEHNLDEGKMETTQIVGETSIRRSRRRRLSNSPAMSLDKNEAISCVGEDSRSIVKKTEISEVVTEHTEKKTQITQKSDKLQVDTLKLSKQNMDKEKIETVQIVDDSPSKRKLKTRLSNSPAMKLKSNLKFGCVSKESSTERKIENSNIVTEHSYTEIHPGMTQNSDKLKINTLKQSEHNLDEEKMETIQIVGETSIRRSRRRRLSNTPAMSSDTNKAMICVSEDSRSTVKKAEISEVVTEHNEKISHITQKSDKQQVDTLKLSRVEKKIENSEVVAKHSNTVKRSEITQLPAEPKMDTSKLLNHKMENEKIVTIQVVGNTSVRRSLRSRLSSCTACSTNTNKIRSSINLENRAVKANDSTQIVTERSNIEKHNEMTQNHENVMIGEKIDIKHIEEGNSTSAEQKIEARRVADESRTDSEKQEEVKPQITLVTDEQRMITAKQTDKVIYEPSIDVAKTAVDHSVNIINQTEIIQKAKEQNTDPIILIPNNKLMDKSCIDQENSTQTKVTEIASIPTADTKETIGFGEITFQSSINSNDATDATQSIITHSIDIKEHTKIVKQSVGHSSSDKPVKSSEKVNNCNTDKHVQPILVKNEQPIKDVETVLDEYNEYGHLDFVFSSLNEKLSASNDVGEPVIDNYKNDIANNYYKKVESINRINFGKSYESTPNIDSKIDKTNQSNAILGKLNEKSVKSFASTHVAKSNNKQAAIDNYKCKYKKLYESCTEFTVRIERMPRLNLTRKNIINIKDLDEKFLLGSALKKGVKKPVIDSKNTTVADEKISDNVIENTGIEITCIPHTADRITQVVPISMDNINDASEISANNKVIQNVPISIDNKNDTSEISVSNEIIQKVPKTIDNKNNASEMSIDNKSIQNVPKNIDNENNASEISVRNEVIQNVPITIVNEIDTSEISVNNKSIENIVCDKTLNNDAVTFKHNEQNHANALNTKSDCVVSEKVVFNEVYDKKVSFKRPESKQNYENTVIHVNTVTNGEINSNKKTNTIEINQEKVDKTNVKSDNVECIQIKPSPLANGFEYIYDDDEDEFESPAFSPIFKEPIDTTAIEKDSDNEIETVTSKNDTYVNEYSITKDATTNLPRKTDYSGLSGNVTHIDTNALIKKESDDELITSVKRLPEPVKMNGFHLDEYGLDFSDNDFNVESSSINSEDSEPLSVTKNKLVSKIHKNVKKTLQDVEFVKYLELRQDALMDEHPELNQDEIVEYLYKTWQYEENSKSEIRKSDDIEQAGLVKGLNDNLRQKSLRNSYRENKKKSKKRDADILSNNSNVTKKRLKEWDEDTLSINSDISDTSTRRRPRTRLSNSPAISIDENEFSVSKESSPERKPDIEDKMSLLSDDSIKLTKRRVRNQILDDSLDGDESFSILKEDPKSKVVPPIIITVKQEISRPKRSLEKRQKKSPKSYDVKIKKYFAVVNPTTETKNSQINEQNTIDVNKIKEEYDPDTVSIASCHSEDYDVCLSKRKRKNADKQSAKSMDNPEFLKYVELRQDVLIDENPQLTQDEIVTYLYKTWLYEESVKSDLKKSDDIEQANLVKGLNSEVQTKKIRKKIKFEKNLIDEEIAPKEKPRRKISQPYYNEDTMSDIEDEIELFEIFNTMKKPNEIKSEDSGALKKTNEVKSSENEEIVIQDEIDEVELYFSQLPLPKPNLFKSLVREKVCEICEKTGNLVKCKGCSGMFHADCEMKAPAEEGVVTSTRGRKKKQKKRGRKPKDFDDSESHSDEKSQDVSEEHNASIEEVEIEPRVVDEAVIEAALTSKMKELLPTIDLTYDSYSSDDGLDWNNAQPGHCEIVDVKLKPKVVIDYSDFKCKNCQKYTTPVCFVCKEAVSKTGVKHRQKCQTNHCNKYYHLECLDHWPQTQFNSGEPSKNNKKIKEHFEAVMCPRHVCHTCVSDDPRGCRTRFSGDKLARCVRCPATYHSFTKCLPAGTQILTGSLIVCPRHYEHRPGKVPCHVNTGWCFICALGGSLICCEYCPTSFHAECLNIEPPEGGYMCEDCETGRLPLYGEMVWVKLGHYRWWPGIILHPSEIPENIMAVKHSPGEFVVRFFGQYDHYWVNRGRVFHFQEGDSGRISTQKSKIDAAFITAMEHAHRAFEILKTAQPNDEESQDIASSLLPPHYVKLKVNKPCGSLIGRRPDIEESSLTQCECDPLVEDPCGPYSHCLNRMLLTECGPICRAGDRCSNRAFEKRLYPKMVPYRTPHRGWGLKTLVEIKAGQFVIEYVGELLDEEEFRRRMNRMHEVRDENFYFLTLDKERMIDAGPKGNLARFMNHCCEPNCETQKWTVLGDVRVGLFAINDIPANSELTFNYNLECTGIEKKRCMCGARRCSGYIGAKPKQEETLPRKKRAYKKRAKPVDESPSTSKIKPKRPVGRPAKPRELTEIEKDLLIIKNATNGISSDSESSSRLSIDNLNPKALKRKRVDFSTEESGSSSPVTKKSKIDETCDSPSMKKAKIDEMCDSPDAKKAKMEVCDSPSTEKAKVEELCDSPSAKKAKIEELCDSPSTEKSKIEELCDSPDMNKSKIEEMSLSMNDSKIEELITNKVVVVGSLCDSPSSLCDSPNTNKVNIEEKCEVGD